MTILLMAWLLLRQSRQIGLPARLFLPLALCICGFVLGNTPIAALRPAGLAGTIAHAASGFVVVFLWWFCLACFDRRFRVRGGVLIVGLCWGVIAALDRGLFGDDVSDKGLSLLLVPLGFGLVGHLVWRLLAERDGDLIQRRHDARIMVSILLGGMLFVDLSVDALFGFAWRPQAFAIAQNAMILAFGLWLADRLLIVRTDPFGIDLPERTLPPTDPPPIFGDPRNDALRRRLTELIERERIFLDPDLTFAALVGRMRAPERAVRTLVNHDLGYDHFRTFLNHHRVAEARRLLADPAHNDDKLIMIALDSGFASLASFNRAFRAIEGRAPSQYRTGLVAGIQTTHGPGGPGFEERKAVI